MGIWRGFWVGNHLNETKPVPKINEDHSTMVTSTVYPTGKRDPFSFMFWAKFATPM
jgi:hypothetical protein